MERSYDERIVMYFCKKNISSALLLLILGFGIVSVGINREDSYIFIGIGVVFGVMAVWMWIRQRFISVKGTEVDDSAKKYMSKAQIRTKALKELEIDEEDIEGLDKLILKGYSPMGINTEPFFRVDREDGKARSSNYQITYFIMDETVMFTYSQTKSLIDSEFYGGEHVWRFKAIKECRIETVPKLCMTAPGKEEEKEEKTFNVLIIKGENKEIFGFAFDEEDRSIAEYIDGYINKRIQRENRMRKPNSHSDSGKPGKSDKERKTGI